MAASLTLHSPLFYFNSTLFLSTAQTVNAGGEDRSIIWVEALELEEHIIEGAEPTSRFTLDEIISFIRNIFQKSKMVHDLSIIGFLCEGIKGGWEEREGGGGVIRMLARGRVEGADGRMYGVPTDDYIIMLINFIITLNIICENTLYI